MKKLILMQAVPGAGKSYLAREILSEYNSKEGFWPHLGGPVDEGNGSFSYPVIYPKHGIILSTDNFWMTSDGVYKFDASLLGVAHRWCQKLCAKAMFYDTPLIIVDNTNIKKKDVRVYLDLSLTFCYSVEVARPKTDWATNAEECCRRCTHGVPLDTIKRMLAQMEDLL